VLTRKRRTRFLAVAMAATFVGALSLLANAASADPPGNNGTVKIDGEPFDTVPDNQPHVGCTFQVDFYGFDEGDLNADVKFEAWAPTQLESDSQVLLTDTVFIGEDSSAGGGSEAGLDAEKTYTLDLTGITPHPQQGVHVKLTINAPFSQGADVKHKVFWVTGCGGGGGGTTTTTQPGETTTTTTPGETTTTTQPGETTTTTTPGETTSTTAPGGGGGGASSSQTTAGAGSSASSTEEAGGLPFTGSSGTVPMVIAGLLMVGLGLASLLVNRLRQRQNGA
jgi:hypothetical protein